MIIQDGYIQIQDETLVTRLRAGEVFLQPLVIPICVMAGFQPFDQRSPGGRDNFEGNSRHDSFFKARESILNFGRAAEVLEPEALKVSVIDYARQIVDFYQA